MAALAPGLHQRAQGGVALQWRAKAPDVQLGKLDGPVQQLGVAKLGGMLDQREALGADVHLAYACFV